MYCIMCGQKLSNEELFCCNCGTRIIRENTQTEEKRQEEACSDKNIGISKIAAAKIRKHVEDHTFSPRKFGEHWYSWSIGEILNDSIVDSLADIVNGIEDEIPLLIYKYNSTLENDFREGFILTNYRIIIKFGSKSEEWFWNQITGVTYDKILLAHVMYLNLNVPGKKISRSIPLTYLDHLKDFKFFFSKLVEECLTYIN